MHVFRWDLDKTYLETDIESVRGLLRAAMQTAEQKRNVPGSAALLRALQRSPDARVFVLSGSPTQMREVLEAKLRLDGIDFERLVLKDNLGNLKRGRLRAVRDQLGYKLPQLLIARRDEANPGARESLFGDDSEVDALVYAAYASVVDGSLDVAGLERLLTLGRAYPDAAQLALDAARVIPTAAAVEDIFIRVEQGTPLRKFDLLAGRVTPVFSWLQAALALAQRGHLDRAQLVDVVRACVDEAGLTAGNLAGLFQDAVRRQVTTADHAAQVAADRALGPASDVILRALDRLGNHRDTPSPHARPDWAGFLRST